MFHIVFQPRDVDVLNAAMDLDEALDGEIVCISDDYSIGPIADLSSEEGTKARKAWLNQLAHQPPAAPETDPVADDQEKLQQVLDRMREEEFDRIWIWIAPNARDLSGYFRVIGLFSGFAGRIDVLSLNNLPFINEKGAVFYPAALSEIPPREFIKAKKLARPVSLSEFETDPDEWLRLGLEHKNLRILEGARKLSQQDEDYFDAQLKKFLTGDFQKPARIIHQFISRSPIKTGEPFLLWRLRQLAGSGELEQQGDLLRIPAAAVAGAGNIDATL